LVENFDGTKPIGNLSEEPYENDFRMKTQKLESLKMELEKVKNQLGKQ
jgi:hypothetical protein